VCASAWCANTWIRPRSRKRTRRVIDLVERAIEDLKKLGATMVDPGPAGLFTEHIKRYNPMLHNATFTKKYPELFPVDAQGKPTGDHIATLVDLAVDPSRVPGPFTLRRFFRRREWRASRDMG